MAEYVRLPDGFRLIVDGDRSVPVVSAANRLHAGVLDVLGSVVALGHKSRLGPWTGI